MLHVTHDIEVVRSDDAESDDEITNTVRSMVKTHGTNYRHVIVTAGCYRFYDIQSRRNGDTLELDFYSVRFPFYWPGWKDFLIKAIDGINRS